MSSHCSDLVAHDLDEPWGPRILVKKTREHLVHFSDICGLDHAEQRLDYNAHICTSKLNSHTFLNTGVGSMTTSLCFSGVRTPIEGNIVIPDSISARVMSFFNSDTCG